jgi:hypothetical protein
MSLIFRKRIIITIIILVLGSSLSTSPIQYVERHAIDREFLHRLIKLNIFYLQNYLSVPRKLKHEHSLNSLEDRREKKGHIW